MVKTNDSQQARKFKPGLMKAASRCRDPFTPTHPPTPTHPHTHPPTHTHTAHTHEHPRAHGRKQHSHHPLHIGPCLPDAGCRRAPAAWSGAAAPPRASWHPAPWWHPSCCQQTVRAARGAEGRCVESQALVLLGHQQAPWQATRLLVTSHLRARGTGCWSLSSQQGSLTQPLCQWFECWTLGAG